MAKQQTDTAFICNERVSVRQKIRQLPASLVLGSVIFSAVLVLALFGPYLSPYGYDEFHILDRFQAPNATFLFGTDEYGRDIFTRTLFGSRLSLFLGVSATFVSLVLGVPLGLIAGYFRGRIDEAIMRCLDVVIAFPPVVFVLLIMAATEPAIWKTAGTIGLLFTPAMARVTRSITLELGSREFIVAAHARGETTIYILMCEILPNAWPPILVEGSLRVTFAILIGAVLSFLGFGVRPPSADWGLMISQARSFLEMAPWIALAPGLAMCITVIAVNLIGDGLREYIDPLRRRRK